MFSVPCDRRDRELDRIVCPRHRHQKGFITIKMQGVAREQQSTKENLAYLSIDSVSGQILLT